MVRSHDEVDARILDATLQRILQVGVRRSSLDDIARRSGVNRVTIYRRFENKDALVEAALSREIDRVLAEATAIVTATSGVEAQIEETVLYILRLTRTHPLVTQLIEVAPEEVLGFYTVRGEEMVPRASTTSWASCERRRNSARWNATIRVLSRSWWPVSRIRCC